MCVCVYIHAWRPEVDKGYLPSVSPLYSKAGLSLSPELTYPLVYLACSRDLSIFAS